MSEYGTKPFYSGASHWSKSMQIMRKNSWPCRHFPNGAPQAPSNELSPAKQTKPGVALHSCQAASIEFVPFSRGRCAVQATPSILIFKKNRPFYIEECHLFSTRVYKKLVQRRPIKSKSKSKVSDHSRG